MQCTHARSIAQDRPRARARRARAQPENVSLDIPRDALVVFTGVSGSGKSSLAFGTLYAEAQRRYLESVSPYARRLFHQMPVPEVDEIDGLPPAVALQQQRGTPTTRSSVGSVSTLVELPAHAVFARRRLSARPGTAVRRIVFAEYPGRRLPQCSGLGRVYEVTEQSMVPDDSLTIRERAVAAWPPAWHGQNLRDILVTMGYDVDTPWRDLPKKDRDWILFTDETPTVPVYAGLTPEETKRALKRKETPSYQGTFTARALRAADLRQYRKRVDEEARGALHGQHRVPAVPRQAPAPGSAVRDLRRHGHHDDMSRMPLERLHALLRPYADGRRRKARRAPKTSGAADRHAAHRRRPVRAPRRAAGAGPGLPGAGAQHADAVAGRAAAPAPGDAGAFEPVRRRVRAGRAVGRPASGRHRSAAGRARRS
jgi:excinuclease ABC subunit A